MFERRLTWMGVILAAFTLLLLGRLLQVQVLGRNHYTALATDVMTQERMLPTARGPIVDVRGRVIAEDAACVDAAVDFRAVTRDLNRPFVKDWISRLALQRLRNSPQSNWSEADVSVKKLLRKDEEQRVREDIAAMWTTLAVVSRLPPEELEEIRGRIEKEVRWKKRQITWRRYRSAVEEVATREKPSWYHRWLVAGGDELPTEDEFDDELIYEEQAPHVVLRALSLDAQNELGRNTDRLPGLVLQISTHRVYPYRNHAAHVIGYVGRVQPEDLAGDPDSENELKAYRPNDLAGRAGIEALAERLLRGTRGQESQNGGDWAAAARVDPVAGRSVTCTLDMELQAHIRDAFLTVKIPHPDRTVREYQTAAMHGAAVVIDVPTGEVRALVSFPDYDLNTFADDYAQMRVDDGNKPLLNRATLSQLEPGSTVKPMVGLAALAAGLVTLDERIECVGFLMLRHKRWDRGRCWTATSDVVVHPHHSIPSADPHHGPTPNLDGHLNFTEAIQRSCNVYFENMADRLGAAGLSDWFEKFGLGRLTGIGVAEEEGMVPRGLRGPAALFGTWTAGIGQGRVLATPLQMANAMATIARGGVWVRPSIVRDGESLRYWHPAAAKPQPPTPDRIDLRIPPEAMRAAHRGMMAVVSTPAGSAYLTLNRPDVSVAAKTGTAQAEFFKILKRDSDGTPLLDADGRKQWTRPRPGTWNAPNLELPWYRASDIEGQKVHHAWMVGFAPADDPKIAFAVMVEYGGAGGGAVAGPLAAELLEACVEHGYVRRKSE